VGENGAAPLRGVVPVNAKMAKRNRLSRSLSIRSIMYSQRYAIKKLEDRDRIRYVKNSLLKGLATQPAPRTSTGSLKGRNAGPTVAVGKRPSRLPRRWGNTRPGVTTHRRENSLWNCDARQSLRDWRRRSDRCSYITADYRKPEPPLEKSGLRPRVL
jgi:hypothetical protein